MNMNDVSLKEYIEARLQDRASAIDLARNEVERRLVDVNELRKQLEERLRALEAFKSNIDGKMLAIGGVMLIIQLVIMAFGLFWLKK